MTDWERLAAVAPDALDALRRAVDAAWRATDPVLLELARLRIAALLRNDAELHRRTAAATAAGLTEDRVAALPSWPSSPLFSVPERACLALTEQFVLDANGVTDAQVAAVTDALGPAGCYSFVESISVLEAFQRSCLTLGIVDGVPEPTR